jgi:glyoxylase-like metal-dependent hydrolase (beta-lactamase superfamily II)
VVIHRFSTGRVRQKAGRRGVRRYFVDEWRDETLPVNVFLIEHPGGLCLVDTGQEAASAEPGFFPRWYPFFRLSRFELSLEDEIGAQLENRGIDVDSIRWVVLTHMHTDHVGGLRAVRRSDVIVSDVEWKRANGIRGAINGYVAKQWPRELVPHVVSLTGPPIGPFPASLDLVDDGSLRLVALPGHTPGQIGVLVRAGTAGALLGGDVAHDGRELATAAPEIAGYCEREGLAFLAAHDEAIPELVELGGVASGAAT